MGEFLEIERESYEFCKKAGVFTATLDYKVWGKKCNLISFYTFDTGEKILCNTWWDKKYLQADKIKIGSRVELTFKMNGKENAYLVKVCEIK